jgi:hypothetical protein
MTTHRAASSAREGRRVSMRPPTERDQGPSPFSSILAELVVRTPGTLAVAIVGEDGETVDYAGRLSPFDVKVAAAHVRIILGELEARPALGAAQLLVVRGEKLSFFARPLPDAYALVLIRGRRSFEVSSRPLDVCHRALVREAGWPAVSTNRRSWFDVDVALDERGRPREVASRGTNDLHRVTILGAIAGLAQRERGFRVRLETGVEVTLAREPGNYWYADEDLAATEAAGKDTISRLEEAFAGDATKKL